jgi:hypothetical protein
VRAGASHATHTHRDGRGTGWAPRPVIAWRTEQGLEPAPGESGQPPTVGASSCGLRDG